MHNGSAVPCFGMQEGTIQSAVSGGTAPYSYAWSNGKTTASISDVAAGYYELKVIDALGAIGEAQITLTEPEPLSVTATPHKYANGFNISCYECYNGSIDVEVEQGTPPYAYTWDDASVTTQDRTALGANRYTVLVTDANGCEEKADVTVTQPERSDWTMTGNAGTNPATQYIGTSDNKDVVFKANGQEVLRLEATGAIRASALGTGFGLLMADTLGVVKRLTPGQYDTYVNARPGCPRGENWPWLLCGNYVASDNVIGATNPVSLKFITDNIVRLTIDRWGKVGIGTNPPVNEVDGYRLFVEDGIATRDVLVKLGTWPDYVFDPEHDLLPLPEFREYVKRYHHLPGIPSACELEAEGGVALGDMQRALVRTVEEQALYILQLEEKLQHMDQRLNALEAGTR